MENETTVKDLFQDLASTTWAETMKKEFLHGRDIRDGKRYGIWTYDKKNLQLVCDYYYIDLEECTTCAQVLDWIFQWSNKNETDESCRDLLRALDELLDPQANLCSWGVDRGRLDVKKLLKGRKKRVLSQD